LLQAAGTLPLGDAAAVNTIRWELSHHLETVGLPTETGTDGHTHWNRTACKPPKNHWFDAASMGASTPQRLLLAEVQPLRIAATGQKTCQLGGIDRRGFSIRHRTRQKRHVGFATGDQVRAVVPAGRKSAGWHLGRVVERASGRFDLVTAAGRVRGDPHSVVLDRGATRRLCLCL
jgi:hypothetical protein